MKLNELMRLIVILREIHTLSRGKLCSIRVHTIPQRSSIDFNVVLTDNASAIAKSVRGISSA